jgi:hypothetical protein
MSGPNATEEEYRGKPMIRINDYGGWKPFVFGISNGKKGCRLVHCWELLEEFVESKGRRPQHNVAYELTNSHGEIAGYCVIVPGWSKGDRFYDSPMFTLRGDENPETAPSPKADFQFTQGKANALVTCKEKVNEIILKHYSP